MTHRIQPSLCDVIFMIFVWSLWYALSCKFVSLAYACENSFVLHLVVFAKDLCLPLFIAIFLLWVLKRLQG